jgi:hypothetical protein
MAEWSAPTRCHFTVCCNSARDVVQLRAVRGCCHLKREIATDVTPYVLSIAAVQFASAQQKAELGALHSCHRGPLGNVPREVVVSPAYHLHPEFGLLCPSRRFRRKARVALALLAFLVIAGAFAAKVSHEPGADGALMIADGDVARTDAGAVQTIGQATTTAESPPAPEGSETACERGASSHIGVRCSVGRARKPRSPRAANDAATIAALPLGRIALLAPESSAPPLNPADAANTAISTPAVAEPHGPSSPASKRVRKSSRRNGGHDLPRDWRWPDSQWSARAYALPDNRYPGGRPERSWGRSW